MSQNTKDEALKEARQFILAPAEDLLWGVVHRIDAALSASQEAAAPSDEPSDAPENIINNPKSWAAWKREADSWRRVAERLETEKQAAPSEPVAWHWRKTDRVMKHEDVWSFVDYHTGLKIKEHPEKYETRPLFASPAVAPVAVSVKGLSWVDIDGDIVARNDIKSYCCRRFGDGFDLLIDGHHTKPYIHGFRETHPTIEAAKAAAQADLNARILSSIGERK